MGFEPAIKPTTKAILRFTVIPYGSCKTALNLIRLRGSTNLSRTVRPSRAILLVDVILYELCGSINVMSKKLIQQPRSLMAFE